MHISQSMLSSQKTKNKSKSRTSSVERDPISSTSTQVALSISPKMSRMSLSSMELTTPSFHFAALESIKFAKSETRMKENSWMESSFQRRPLPSQRKNENQIIGLSKNQLEFSIDAEKSVENPSFRLMV